MFDIDAFRAISRNDILALVLGVSFLLYVLTSRKKRLPYPPGPPGLPILGNLLDVPDSKQWEAYAEMSRDTGSPIVHVNVLGTHIVSINDFKTAKEVLEKRGSPLTSRPRNHMLRTVGGHDWNFGHFPYNAAWKTSRRYFDQRMRQSESRKFRPLQTGMVRSVLSRFLETPDAFTRHVRFFATATMLEIAYGITITDSQDPFIEITEHALEAVNESANYQFVDALPWVEHLPGWLPGMNWKSKAPSWRDANKQMRDIPFEAVKKALQSQSAKPSITSGLLEGQSEDKALSDDIIKFVSSTLVAGGVDTTVSALLSIILVVRTFPEVQQAAHAELDRVLGGSRLPDFNDKPDLPYIEALCKEIVRYVCVTPVCLPHFALEDDIWVRDGKEYLIPKDSIVLANAWAMTRDPANYSDPHKFDPSRFLTKEGKPNPDALDPNMVFGFRPRLCPGQAMAEDVMFIFAASFLSVFKIEPLPEENIPTDFDSLFKPGLAIYPREYKCLIKPRSDKAQGLIVGE